MMTMTHFIRGCVMTGLAVGLPLSAFGAHQHGVPYRTPQITRLYSPDITAPPVKACRELRPAYVLPLSHAFRVYESPRETGPVTIIDVRNCWPLLAQESHGAAREDLGIDVQRALMRGGFYRGPIDGDVGPGTRSAIRAFQSERGLPVSGRIDSGLLRALDIG